MPDANGQCTYCHHDSMHHVFPGCDFPSPRMITISGVPFEMPTCGCACFDQPSNINGEEPRVVEF